MSERPPAYVDLAQELARWILDEQVPGGMPLPSHVELATKYGVSDIVVRRAVAMLAEQGLVRSVRRRGVFVADERPTAGLRVTTHAGGVPGKIVISVVNLGPAELTREEAVRLLRQAADQLEEQPQW